MYHIVLVLCPIMPSCANKEILKIFTSSESVTKWWSLRLPVWGCHGQCRIVASALIGTCHYSLGLVDWAARPLWNLQFLSKPIRVWWVDDHQNIKTKSLKYIKIIRIVAIGWLSDSTWVTIKLLSKRTSRPIQRNKPWACHFSMVALGRPKGWESHLICWRAAELTRRGTRRLTLQLLRCLSIAAESH